MARNYSLRDVLREARGWHEDEGYVVITARLCQDIEEELRRLQEYDDEVAAGILAPAPPPDQLGETLEPGLYRYDGQNWSGPEHLAKWQGTAWSDVSLSKAASVEALRRADSGPDDGPAVVGKHDWQFTGRVIQEGGGWRLEPPTAGDNK